MSKTKTENPKIIIKNPNRLKLLFQALSYSMEEINIRLDAIGMSLRGISDNKVTLTDILLPIETFEEFPKIAAGDDGIKLRLKVADVIKVLGRSKPDDTVDFELTSRTFNVVIHSKYTKKYELSMTAFDPTYDKMPKVTYNTELHVGPAVFDEILKDIRLMAETIQIDIKDGKATINGKAKDQNSGTMLDFFSEEPILKVVRNEADISATYDLGMFESLVSVLKSFDTTVEIELDNRTPMRIAYKVKDFGSLHHFVAPFIRET